MPLIEIEKLDGVAVLTLQNPPAKYVFVSDDDGIGRSDPGRALR